MTFIKEHGPVLPVANQESQIGYNCHLEVIFPVILRIGETSAELLFFVDSICCGLLLSNSIRLLKTTSSCLQSDGDFCTDMVGFLRIDFFEALEFRIVMLSVTYFTGSLLRL